MWRRIHSNRDPRDTLYSELRKEFHNYFEKAGNSLRLRLVRYPKFFFGMMISFLLVSMVLVSTVFRHSRQIVKPVLKKNVASLTVVSPVSDGFDQILVAGARINETLRLKRLVDSISLKSKLSHSDSLALDTALTRLQQINSPKK